MEERGKARGVNWVENGRESKGMRDLINFKGDNRKAKNFVPRLSPIAHPHISLRETENGEQSYTENQLSSELKARSQPKVV